MSGRIRSSNTSRRTAWKRREFQRGALGEEAERLDQVSQGLLEVSMSDVKSAGTLDSLIFGVYLPYFFADAAEVDKGTL